MLTLAAFYYHPDMEVARAEWDVARAAIQTAGGRPNPTLNVTPGLNFSHVNAAPGSAPGFPSSVSMCPWKRPASGAIASPRRSSFPNPRA